MNPRPAGVRTGSCSWPTLCPSPAAQTKEPIMPVKKDKDGHRYVEAEVEVPGSPEEVWRAIATGSGVSSWFVPSTVEEKVGGTAVSSFGPGMDSVATIKTWNPPRSFSIETDEEPVGKVATEWIVEAR